MGTDDRDREPSSTASHRIGGSLSENPRRGALESRYHPVVEVLAFVAVVGGIEGLSHLTVHRLLPRGSDGWGALFDAAVLSISLATLVFRFVVAPVRKRMKELADASSAVVRSMSDAVITIDERGEIHGINPAAEATFGYRADELVGCDVSRLMPEIFASPHQDFLKTDLSGKRAPVIGQRRELNAVRKSGEVLAVELTVSELWAGGQRILTLIVRDLTVEQDAGRRLAQSYTLLQGILQLQSSFIQEGDPRLRSALFERALDQILSLSDSEFGFIGEALHDPEGAVYLRTHAISNVAWDEKTRQFYDTHLSAGLEFRNLKSLFGAVLTTKEPVVSNAPADDLRRAGLPPGHPPLHSFLGLPLIRSGELVGMIGVANRPGGYDTGLIEYLQPWVGTCAGMVGAFADQRRRRETEVALSENEERHRVILDSALDAVVGMSAGGDVIHWSLRAERLFGWTSEEAMGRKLADCTVPSDLREAHTKGLRRFMATGENNVLGRLVEIRALHRDGHEFPVELTVTRYQWGGELAFSAFIRDITDRKAAEHQQRAARASAEAASRAKSDFLATMSHEIRTPMNGIIGMTDLALRTNLSEEQRRYLDLVRLSADALMTLINEILDFSKIEAGRLELEAVEFDPGQVLLEALRPLAVRCCEKRLELVLRVHPEVPLRVIGDPARLVQVIANLVANAVKFTEEGEILVELRRAWRSTDDVCLELLVSDTGIGILPEALETIFEPFVQADMSTTRRYGGTGLGLAICKRIAALMDGSIQVSSELGRGSEFTFTACFALPMEDASPSKILRDPLLEHLPVTLVEDSRAQAEALSRCLAELGAEPTVAHDGPDALRQIGLAAAGGEPPAVVVIDQGMAGMDGLSVVECLKTIHPGIPSVFVLLRQASESVDADRLKRLGVEWVVEKPCRAQELCEAVVGALGGESRHPSTCAPERVPDLRTAVGRPRILVVEDNFVNQKLALWLLEINGYDAVVASNGREALAILEFQSFDAILMDVQMPELNGLDATRLIRDLEAVEGGHIPIIAVTASAMVGDRERCLEAGMDAYLPKPLDEHQLIEMLSTLLFNDRQGAAIGDPSPAPTTLESTGDAAFSFEAVLRHYRGDRELVSDMAAAYLDEVPDRLVDLRAAVECGNLEALERNAHGLKGSTSYFYATSAVNALQQLQQAGRDGDLAAARDILTTAIREVEAVANELRRAAAAAG